MPAETSLMLCFHGNGCNSKVITQVRGNSFFKRAALFGTCIADILNKNNRYSRTWIERCLNQIRAGKV